MVQEHRAAGNSLTCKLLTFAFCTIEFSYCRKCLDEGDKTISFEQFFSVVRVYLVRSLSSLYLEVFYFQIFFFLLSSFMLGELQSISRLICILILTNVITNSL